MCRYCFGNTAGNELYIFDIITLELKKNPMTEKQLTQSNRLKSEKLIRTYLNGIYFEDYL